MFFGDECLLAFLVTQAFLLNFLQIHHTVYKWVQQQGQKLLCMAVIIIIIMRVMMIIFIIIIM